MIKAYQLILNRKESKMAENKQILPDKLYRMICEDRQVITNSNQAFSDPVLKKRHDDMDLNKEIERINNDWYE